MKAFPTIERIRELFDVDADAGVILWRKGQGRAQAGSIAGRITVRGYREVCIDRKQVFAHSVIWYAAFGDWPTRIDHINGDRVDNRIANLRLCDAATNSRNRTNWVHTKLLGAHPRHDGKFVAAIVADGIRHYLGTFETEQEAHSRYCVARDICAEAEKVARQAALQSLNAGRHERERRAQLTVLEEMQAERAAA